MRQNRVQHDKLRGGLAAIRLRTGLGRMRAEEEGQQH